MDMPVNEKTLQCAFKFDLQCALSRNSFDDDGNYYFVNNWC